MINTIHAHLILPYSARLLRSAHSDTLFGRRLLDGQTPLLMAPTAPTARPDVQASDYLRTIALPSRMRCRIYDNPPPVGRYVATLPPDTLFGPVMTTVSSARFETVQIGAGWVNIWGSDHGGKQFAFVEEHLKRTARRRWADDIE